MPKGSAPGERRGGRQKGTPNRKNAETIAKAAASGLLPHEFLAAVARGEMIDGHQPTFDERMTAAAQAAPYYAPKLAATTMSGPGGGPMQVQRIERVIVDPRHAVDTDAPRLRAVAGGKPV